MEYFSIRSSIQIQILLKNFYFYVQQWKLKTKRILSTDTEAMKIPADVPLTENHAPCHRNRPTAASSMHIKIKNIPNRQNPPKKKQQKSK